MSWRIVVRPEVEEDLAEAAAWYEAHQPGLGAEFVEEISIVWGRIAQNPFLRSRKHPRKKSAGAIPTGFRIGLSMRRMSPPELWWLLRFFMQPGTIGIG